MAKLKRLQLQAEELQKEIEDEMLDEGYYTHIMRKSSHDREYLTTQLEKCQRRIARLKRQRHTILTVLEQIEKENNDEDNN